MLPHSLQDCGLDVLECGALHDAVGTGVGVQCGHERYIRAVEHIAQLQVCDAVLPEVQADILQIALFGDVLIGFQNETCNKDMEHRQTSCFDWAIGKRTYKTL